jgi:hypothetical protein
MAYVRAKWIPGENGKQYGPYYYLVKGERRGNTVVTKHIKYLGKFGTAGEAASYAVMNYGPEIAAAASGALLGTTEGLTKVVVPKKDSTEDVVPKKPRSKPVVPKKRAADDVVPKQTPEATTLRSALGLSGRD